VKGVATILCALALMLGQFPALAANACAAPVKACCHCSGKMACCSQNDSSTPAPATPARTGSEDQNQLWAQVPAAVFVGFPAAGTIAFRPASHFSPTFASAPLFARNCVRLI
jgi:hypothetical protein